ncbi:CIC11C00000001893 [Sungouiella intermedia]|uniref:CIC11C00000001893 n=1 Tax=Sungouiella intermedia TaxID=45354 RepID=A0A1L0DG19_9ASCO|nr:CIC11C00000001893 [[Candida] intermedia]
MPCTGSCRGKPRVEKAEISNEMSDDIWASDDEGVSTYADRRRAQINQGYLDGLTSAQELGLQDGFDEGYPEGAKLGIRVGRILAELFGSTYFEQALKELNITKVLDRKYYNEQLDANEPDHELVAYWEQKVKDTKSHETSI